MFFKNNTYPKNEFTGLVYPKPNLRLRNSIILTLILLSTLFLIGFIIVNLNFIKSIYPVFGSLKFKYKLGSDFSKHTDLSKWEFNADTQVISYDINSEKLRIDAGRGHEYQTVVFADHISSFLGNFDAEVIINFPNNDNPKGWFSFLFRDFSKDWLNKLEFRVTKQGIHNKVTAATVVNGTEKVVGEILLEGENTINLRLRRLNNKVLFYVNNKLIGWSKNIYKGQGKFTLFLTSGGLKESETVIFIDNFLVDFNTSI